MTLYWSRLGIDDGGLPTHLPMGVTATGQGPADDSETHHYVCWCGDARCPLTDALRDAWEAGRRQGHNDATGAMSAMSNDPDWERQAPTLSFMATLDQELIERPGHLGGLG